ncbi:MAG TPA: histidine phosphatase family protein [Caulobacteraceae bacterium]|nr:histidine phosphatase family protein [Caulobacteraceae bacterium]
MHTLILLRHGKAETTSGGGGDFERGLTDRGKSDSALIGHTLARAGIAPDLVLVSTARRAMETWEAARAAFPSAKVAPARELYHATLEVLEEAIEAAGAAVSRLMIVGHNPGLHELALALSSARSSGAAKTLAESFPTAAAAVFERNRQGQLTLDRFLTPRRERA